MAAQEGEEPYSQLPFNSAKNTLKRMYDKIKFTENRPLITEVSNTRRGYLKIIAYEFYFRNALKGYEFLGILPERRKDPRRITKGSIKKLGRRIIGGATDSKELFFTQVTIDMDTGRIIHPINPS